MTSIWHAIDMGKISKLGFYGMVKFAVVEWSYVVGNHWRLTEKKFLQCCYILYLFGNYLSYEVRISGIQGPLMHSQMAWRNFPPLSIRR